MATLGVNGSSLGWKPGSCGGGGPLFIPPDRQGRMQRNMNINIDQMNIDRILEKTRYQYH